MKKIFSLIAFLFMTLILAAQDNPEAWRLGHWLSPEEMLRKHEIGRGFVETDPPVGPARNFAEYEKMQGALVRYPFGIPIALIKEMSEDVMVTTIVLNEAQKNTVITQYQNAGVIMANTNFILSPSDSYWTRDYGPWFAADSSNDIGIVDFPYNRPRPNDDDIPKKVAEMLGIPWYGMRVIHTGGNYMTDGFGISSSTTLVIEENPTQTPAEINQKMHDYLGISNYMVVDDPNGTYIDHIDCWGKFLAPDKIIIRKVPPTDPQYDEVEATAAWFASQTCSYGYNYRVFRVYTPNGQPYTNSVILNNKVLVPFMNSTWDDSAKAAYQAAMPGYEIIGFIGNPSTPWESTDALHCRVMGIADLKQIHINHIPLAGNQPAQDNFRILADVICYSDSAVYGDSVLLYYKVNNGDFNMIHMTNTSGNHYQAYIPKQTPGSVIRYYLYAADKSGHNAMAPFIGPADPFTFTAIYTDITAIPDTLWFNTYEEALEGKTSMLHNYTTGGITLNSLEPDGIVLPVNAPWYVDNYPNPPVMINASDSLPVLVKFSFMVDNPVFNGYNIDSVNFESTVGAHKIILMLNDTLTVWGSTNDKDNLLQLENYPNPFSTHTTIGYELKTTTSVRLTVMNAVGAEVMVLGNRVMQAGRHSMLLNGNSLSSGVYFVRLTTPEGSVTKKMMLIR